MAEITIYVTDTETVGRDPAPDSVVELAVVPLHIPDTESAGASTIMRDDYFEQLVRPGVPITYGAMATHHITNDMVADGPDLATALGASPIGFAKTPPVLCAHNAPFDKSFLDFDLPRLPWAADGGEAYWVDTYRAARHVLPGLEGYSNQSLRYELSLQHPDLPKGGAHRALGDALVTALLMQRLLLEKSLREICALQNQPILIDRMAFGKHRGQLMSEDVPLDYLKWIWTKSDLGPDEKHSAEHWFRQRTRREPVHVGSGLENV